MVSVTAPRPENPSCSLVIFPNVCGFRKFTAVDGAEKNGDFWRADGGGYQRKNAILAAA